MGKRTKRRDSVFAALPNEHLQGVGPRVYVTRNKRYSWFSSVLRASVFRFVSVNNFIDTNVRNLIPVPLAMAP